jgi:hypothetical protein
MHSTYIKIQTTHLVAVACNLSQDNTLTQSQPKCLCILLIVLMFPSLCTVPSQHFRTFQSSNFSFLDSSYNLQTSVTARTMSSHTLLSKDQSSVFISCSSWADLLCTAVDPLKRTGHSAYRLMWHTCPTLYPHVLGGTQNKRPNSLSKQQRQVTAIISSIFKLKCQSNV